METFIKIDNGDVLAGVRGFLRQLMETGVVEALYVPLQAEGGAITPALVTDPSWLDQADPLSPVMPINGARAVSALTGKHAPARLGVVLRPCEIRALVELVKLQQATLEGVTLISLDCPGTCEVKDYGIAMEQGGLDLGKYLEGGSQGGALDAPALRDACQMCVQPVYDGADIALHLFGADLRQGIPVALRDEIAASMHLEGVSIDTSAAEASLRREQVVGRLLAAHGENRQKELTRIRQRLTSDGGMASLFATCLRCHNCMTACPICYCKTCLFRSEAMSHTPEYYLNSARRKGVTRLLSDTLLFQLTRLSHMVTSCVSCGMCTSACPVDIPVGAIFSAIGEQVQASFTYHPGQSVSEPLPLITFQPNEWTEIGEHR
jgi:formate dehydrogenase subunit beta